MLCNAIANCFRDGDAEPNTVAVVFDDCVTIEHANSKPILFYVWLVDPDTVTDILANANAQPYPVANADAEPFTVTELICNAVTVRHGLPHGESVCKPNVYGQRDALAVTLRLRNPNPIIVALPVLVAVCHTHLDTLAIQICIADAEPYTNAHINSKPVRLAVLNGICHPQPIK